MQFQAPPAMMYQNGMSPQFQASGQYMPPPSPYAVASQVPLIRNPSASNMQYAQPNMASFPMGPQSFGSPMGFPGYGGQAMGPVGGFPGPFMPQPQMGYPQPQPFSTRPTLTPPQQTIPILPTNSTYNKINTKIEQDKIHCVICNSDFLPSQRQEHVRRHQRQRDEGGKIKKLVREYKEEYVGPQTRPIVQPEEYNVQYNPNSFVLEKVVNYSTPAVQPPPPPPPRQQFGVGTSDMNPINTMNTMNIMPKLSSAQPPQSSQPPAANIADTFRPETVRLTKDGEEIVQTDANMYNAERMIRESNASRASNVLPPPVQPVQEPDSRFSRGTVIPDQPMAAVQPQPVPNRQTIQPQPLDQSYRVSQAPAMSKLNSPMPPQEINPQSLTDQMVQKVVLGEEQENKMDRLSSSQNRNVYSRQYNSDDFSRPPTVVAQPPPANLDNLASPPPAQVNPIDPTLNRVSQTPQRMQSTNLNKQDSQRTSTIPPAQPEPLRQTNLQSPQVQPARVSSQQPVADHNSFYGGRSPDDKIIPRQSRLASSNNLPSNASQNLNPNVNVNTNANVNPVDNRNTTTNSVNRNTTEANPYFPFSQNVPAPEQSMISNPQSTPIRETVQLDPRTSTVPAPSPLASQQPNRTTSISSFNANEPVQPRETVTQPPASSISQPPMQPSRVSSQQPSYGQAMDDKIIPRQSRMQHNSYVPPADNSSNQPPLANTSPLPARDTSMTQPNPNRATNLSSIPTNQPTQPRQTLAPPSTISQPPVQPSRVSSQQPANVPLHLSQTNPPIQPRQTIPPPPPSSYNQPMQSRQTVASQPPPPPPANTYGQALDDKIIPRQSRVPNNSYVPPVDSSVQPPLASSQNTSPPPPLRDTTFSQVSNNTSMPPQNNLANTQSISPPPQPQPVPQPASLKQSQADIPISDIINQKSPPSYTTSQPPIQPSIPQPQSQSIQQPLPQVQASTSIQQPPSTNLNPIGETSMIETYQPKPEKPLEIIQPASSTATGARKKLPRFVGGW